MSTTTHKPDATLSGLPEELVSKIISIYELDVKTLWSLSLTCKTFFRVAQPLLYPKYESDGSDPRPILRSFLRTTIAYPDLASRVTRLRLGGWSVDSVEDLAPLTDSDLGSFCTATPCPPIPIRSVSPPSYFGKERPTVGLSPGSISKLFRRGQHGGYVSGVVRDALIVALSEGREDAEAALLLSVLPNLTELDLGLDWGFQRSLVCSLLHQVAYCTRRGCYEERAQHAYHVGTSANSSGGSFAQPQPSVRLLHGFCTLRQVKLGASCNTAVMFELAPMYSLFKFPSLRIVHAHGCSQLGSMDDGVLLAWPQGTSSVEELKFTASRLDTEAMTAVLGACRSLKSFEFDRVISFPKPPSEVVVLAMMNADCSHPRIVDVLRRHKSSLESLILHSSRSVPSEATGPISSLRAFQRLAYVNVPEFLFAGIPRQQIPNIRKSLPPNLETLIISGWSDVNSHWLIDLATENLRERPPSLRSATVCFPSLRPAANTRHAMSSVFAQAGLSTVVNSDVSGCR